MILKHRDREVLRFDWIKPFGVCHVELNQRETQFLPIEFRDKATDVASRDFVWALENWLLHRMAPMNRHFVRTMLIGAGFDPANPGYLCRLIEFCKGLSLTDVHWVVPDDFNGTWRKCNLYQNDFSESVAALAFAGMGHLRDRDIATSPEYTTNGVLAKCWRRKGNCICLWKAGSESKQELEPLAEFYTTQIAAALGINHVPYHLARYKNRVCSVCPLFTSERTGFVPAGKLLTREQIGASIQFSDVFLLDAIVLNDDRHLGNFGFLVDNDKNEISGIAPAFDNGHAFFARAVGRFGEGSPALYASWTDFPGLDRARACDLLMRLRDFRLKRDARFNLSQTDFKAATDFLSQRINNLLDAYSAGISDCS